MVNETGIVGIQEKIICKTNTEFMEETGMSVNRQYFYILYFLFLSSPILVKFKTVERLPSPGRASARHRFPWQPFTVLNLTKIGVLRHTKEPLVITFEAKIDHFV